MEIENLLEMAELSDDSLSDDDALKRDEDNDGPFGGLVFHWASDPLWRSSAPYLR